MAEYRLTTPLRNEDVRRLRAGDRVYLSGPLYTARDMAHKRLYDLIQSGQPLPIDLSSHVIYYVGPTPARPGAVIGSAGPTTAGRMDPYTPALLARGVKGTIGKGYRSAEVREAMVRYGAVYFAATGGAGALLARRIKKAGVVLYEDLGPEAVHLLEVEDFPVVVINDTLGNDLYREGMALYRREPAAEGAETAS